MAATGVQKLSLDGDFRYGTKGSTADTLTANVKDVTLNLGAKAETTTNRNAAVHGMETEKVTLLDVSLSFTVPNRTGDAFVAALQTAYAGRDMIALQALDAASGKGVNADFYIIEMGEGSSVSEYKVKTSKPSDELRDPALFA